MNKKNRKTILVITDGIGHNDKESFNAFKKANKPIYDELFSQTPYSLISTSGLSVGLPQGQMGNSEVGHMTLGSGRVLYQNLVKINKAIDEKTLSKNQALQWLFNETNTIHVIGLLSDGGVHSHIEHIKALACIAKDEGKKVYIHAITDGRDVSPTSSKEFLKSLEEILDEDIELATIGGRFFAMDRDKRWERIRRGYEAIVEAKEKTTLSPYEYIKSQYEKEITDEFINPVAFLGYKGFQKGDGVVLANFRNDRMRQLAYALGDSTFSQFTCKKSYPLITMTNYDDTFTYPIMFDKEVLENTLAEVISRNGLSQFHTAETEKYAHVTFFFNGGVEVPYENESRLLIPSPKVKTYDLEPKMSSQEVTKGVLRAMDEGYDFIVVNYANGDMVGHTGNFEASIQAVEAVDKALGKILKKCDEVGYNFILTSDHGNCEEMRDNKGCALTNHTTYDVYCFVKAHGVSKVQKGGLNNIAPTVLKLMELEIPKQMDKPLI